METNKYYTDDMVLEVKTLLADDCDEMNVSDDVIPLMLQIAGELVLKARYPFKDISELEVPLQYRSRQILIALELINKMGAEGETSHAENGVARTYSASIVSKGLLDGIVPMVGSL